MLSGMAEWAAGVIDKGGYAGLAALIALETIFPPIPSEIILPLAGFLTGQEKMSFVGAVAAATIGSLTGAMVLYYLGRRLGSERLRNAVQKWGKWVLLSTQDYDKASRWFERHGNTAVFFGRFIPGIRSLISLPAGIQHMPMTRFIIYTILGSTLWNIALISLGWWMGARWTEVGAHIQKFETALWVCLGLVVAWWIGRKVFLCRRQEC